MTEKELKDFSEKVLNNSELMQKIDSARCLEDVIQVAKESGFDIDETQWLNLLPDSANINILTDKDLEAVAAGHATNSWICWSPINGITCVGTCSSDGC